ncbi:RNA-directed DNA polymerase, eukaryota, reverse transcriptase zinc-binding domain protein [Tanacetum coccineum]
MRNNSGTGRTVQGLFAKGDHRSKEDEVMKLFSSIFVTNFPENFSAKELWTICNQYGSVVDAFIPDKRSKSGKRFGFVCFIKIFDIDRLVDNLCIIWVGRFKLYANIARFQRSSLNKNDSQFSYNKGVKKATTEVHKERGENGYSKSYAHVDITESLPINMKKDLPAIVLDESCINQLELLYNLMEDAKERFKSNVGTGSWFAQLLQASNSSCIDERVVWEEGYLHTKRICIKTKLAENIYKSFKIIIRGKIFWIRAKEVSGWIPKFEDDDDEDSQSDVEMSKNGSIDEDGGTFKFPNLENESDCEEVAETIFKKNQFSANMKEDYVGKKDIKNGDSISDNNLKYPPGFTPANDDEAQNNPLKESNEERDNYVLNDVPNSKDDKVESNVKKDSPFNSSKNDTGLAQKAKKDWVREICGKNKVNFLSLQETKMENIELFNIKSCWGNFGFEYEHSPSVGEWLLNGKKILIVSVYAPQELCEKKMLWDYLILVLNNWNGEVVIMGDFNEVRTQKERYESIFNIQGVDAFNLFISSAGLEEVLLDGCKFTWCHKSAAKMSELDRFLIFESLMNSCPNISAITLDRYLSDHRPILMRESHFDYGPIPFCFFHYWFDLDGFDNFVEQKWKNSQVTDMNAMSKLMKKLKFLKEQIRMWIKANKDKSKNNKQDLKADLNKIDLMLDKGDANSDILSKRMDVIKSLQELDKLDTMEMEQKTKIKWAIEGDENSKYYHGILNKIRNQLAIRGILVEGRWIEDPLSVKGDIVNDVQSAFVDFEKAYDSVRWDYLEDILKKIGFGEKWCGWIRNCLLSSKGSVIVNGIKLGNSLQMSHLFYADDAIFMGHWSDSNLDTILRVLDCFYHALGLHINMIKSKLMGISVPSAKVDEAANKIGCATLKVPFSYLGSKVGYLMSRTQSWNDIVNNILTRLSKWKLKTLSIRGRLTLLKYVLEHNGNKQIWVKWSKVLASKENGYGVFVLNNLLSGPREDTLLWEDTWRGDNTFKLIYPRLYALETNKNVTVASKLSQLDLAASFRKAPRGGLEECQFNQLLRNMEGVSYRYEGHVVVGFNRLWRFFGCFY